MSANLTIESPNLAKIKVEAGVFTMSAIQTLWAAYNDTRKTSRTGIREAQDILAPKVLTVAQTGAQDDLDLQGASVLELSGSVNTTFSGLRAPSTGDTRIVIVSVTGTGTITMKNQATSQAANQIVTNTGADVTLAPGKSTLLVYLSARWRQVV